MMPPAAADKTDIAHFFSSAGAAADIKVAPHSAAIATTNTTATRKSVTSLKSRTRRSPSVSSR